MDPATLIGLLLVLVGVFIGSLIKGVSPVAFFAVPAAFLIVFLPTFGAAFLGSTMDDIRSFPKLLKKFLGKAPRHDADELIGQIVGLGERARRDGLLALEDEVSALDEPFLKRGLQMAIDGADPETVEEIMDTEIRAMQSRHRQGAKLVSSMGVYAPTFGIIGAVVGLIVTLGKLDNPEELGHGIAAAFIATFWGVFLANGVFLPWSAKLVRISSEEVAHKRLIVEGVLAIQSGFNPRMLDDLMRSHLPPAVRADPASEKKSA
ncbi:MAG: motility protein A [Actinomycetota bacterium]|nr:motility protein A [Actinomycetota bacterium]